MSHPLIAIGLDAADPQLLEDWMAAGHLPTLKRLRRQGAYGRLLNHESYRAETPWTTFLTGTLPTKTGYWGPVKYDAAAYKAIEQGAYKFQEYPPFYALGDDYKVAIFDMPQTQLSEQANGPQVLAWGAHSPQVGSQSLPKDLLDQVQQKYGNHPGLNRDYADCRDLNALTRLQQWMEIGIERRANVCHDWLAQSTWDLLLTIFGETHTAGHYHWHMSQDHPIYKAGKVDAPDTLLALFKAIDTAIAKILTQAPEQSNVLIFSAHGMGANVMDIPSMLFLPELLFRWNYPGQYGLAYSPDNQPLGAPKLNFKKRGWIGEVWDLKYEKNPLRTWLRQYLPTDFHNQLEKRLGPSRSAKLDSPYDQKQKGDSLFWQPANWYRPYWPEMKAFALPSYSEGYVRINLKGRETHGVVDPKDYDAVCDELSTLISDMTDARTGKSMVERIIRTRTAETLNAHNLPDADLVVLWQEETAADTADSSQVGRIGPVPFSRTGSHRAEGFVLGCGPDFEAGSHFPNDIKAVDLAPTILQLMEAPIPDYFDGHPILNRMAMT
ncbi:MAG: alkaline phosphatase family protein [Leptolyngbyaceae cyanobacterium MO_188.B28]|nr:alkaline phosphatase family protein [Leptolyngbyaceae cyanobacterium MO_188.B28]